MVRRGVAENAAARPHGALAAFMSASSIARAGRISAGATATARSSLATAADRSPAAASSRADAAHCPAIMPAKCRETPGDCCGAVQGFDEGRRVLDGGREGSSCKAFMGLLTCPL